jgi:HK97 family phage major capsid protein
MNNKIDEISLDVKKFLGRSAKSDQKIVEIEGKINKMQNYFSRPEMENHVNLEEKSAFNNFIRKGIKSDLVTKAFSGGAEDGGVLVTSSLSKQIIAGINASSPMRQLSSVESISTRSLEYSVRRWCIRIWLGS